ncbi:MAG: DUF4173 domain-containing protein [Devosia sp.]
MIDSPATAANGAAWSRRTLAIGVTAAILVVLGDLLFFPREPGLNLAVFGIALIVALLALNAERMADRAIQVATALAIASLVPLVEAPTLTGFLWGLFGVSILALALARLLPARFEDLPMLLARFGTLAPFRLASDGLRLLGEAGSQNFGGRLGRGLLVWFVPAVFALVFVLLFVAANPLIETALHAIRLEALLDLLDPGRVILWGVIGLMVWPLLAPRLLTLWAGAVQGPVLPKAEGLIFGGVAIRNSLVLFNVIFLVQSAMDLVYLWGGVRLPEGLTYAAYAHRGAYPLIVTALLAAAFVLAAMRRGEAGEKSSLIRWLVYVWIGQNVLLVVSSILRLKFYVEEYALTELRLAAGIWMALVALGLVLIVARIALRRSNGWLIAANLTTLGLTLYAVSIVDVRALIAWYDVTHSYELTGKGQRLDGYLMGDLGWTAMPAVDYFLAQSDGRPDASGDTHRSLRVMRQQQAEFVLQPVDWRSWSWRGERLRQYVLASPYAPDP